MPTRNLIVIFLTTILSFACYLKAERSRYLSVVGRAMQFVELYYLDEVDRRVLFEQAMNGMMESLDQYSAYIGPESFREVEASLDQEFGGVGVEVEKSGKEEPLTVLSPIVGTPAYRAGMRAGDAILEIDGASTIGLELKDAVRLMRGKPGSEVELLVRHLGDEDAAPLSVKREVIVVDSVLGDTRRDDGSWDFHLVENSRIGYLRITTFGKHTVDELKRSLRSGSGDSCPFDGLIVDLRGNAGGLLDAAVEVCDLFVEDGLIVSTRGRDGQVRSSYHAQSDVAVPLDLPIVVLINKYSASASEIVAACLQDHDRAVVAGSRTWGKGTVQNIFELEGGRSALKLTTAGYTRPSGKNIHKRKDATEEEDWGVRPNDKFEVILSTELAQEVFLERRKRDILVTPDDGSEDQDGGGPAAADSVDTPIKDPQMRRAIEHIEQQLRHLDAQSRTV